MRVPAVFAVLLLVALPSSAAVPSSERQALLDLFASTAGSGWTDKTGWQGAAGSECDWHGVTCNDARTAVVGLSLAANELTGSIPASLAALQDLQTLDLSYNNLTGMIPGQLSSLSKLTVLQLSGNSLSGPIPGSLGNLSLLAELGLGANALTGSLPTSIASLTSLRVLDVSHNALTGPLPDLAALSMLERLDIGGNQLPGPIPAWIPTLQKLKHLGIEEAGMTGPLIEGLRNLTQLEQIYAWGNRFEGEIPEWIGELSELRMLLLGSGLTGEIPRSITRLTKLTTLDLQGNVLTGTIPDDIGSLTELQYLSLGENGLSGPIPGSFSDLKKLIDLRLDHNELTGELPSLHGFDALEVLLLHVNRFKGEFPRQLYDAPNLYLVALGSNQFGGPLPADIDSLDAIQILELSQNAFVGQIPHSITNLVQISAGGLSLGYNALRTSDSAVLSFVNARDTLGSGWRATQTLPPANVTAGQVTDRSAVVQWTPIEYIYDGGGYRIAASLTPGGDPVAIAAVSEKETASGIIRGLQPEKSYYISVSSFTSPNGYQRNLVVSEPASPIAIRTGPPVVGPADVAVTKTPAGIVQIGGVAQSASELVLTNYGDVATTVSLTRSDGTFFEIVPASLTLEPGASGTSEIRAPNPQPAGGYWGSIAVTGAGVPADTFVTVELLSVAAPAGNVEAEASTSRVDLFGTVDSTSVGTVSFRNVGNAELTGVLTADVPWIRVPLSLVRITPGEEAIITFTVDRSLRSSDERSGAATGTMALVYVDGGSSQSNQPGQIGAFSTLPPGVSASTVKVVDTAGPGSQAGEIPSLPEGEIARFIPGLRSIRTPDESHVSDVAVANATGVRAIDDLRLYFRAFENSTARVATIGSVAPASAVSLASIAGSVYSSTEGSLQIRSSQWNRLAANAILHVSGRDRADSLSAHPVYRSDRAVEPGQRLVITGLQRNPAGASLILQETSGQSVRLQIESLRSDGSVARTTHVTLDAWGTTAVKDAVVGETATVVISHREDSQGAFVAIAAVTESSGDVSMLADWSRVNGFDITTGARIAWAERHSGSRPRRRGVRRSSTGGTSTAAASNLIQTDLWLFNDDDEAAAGELIWIPTTGSPRRVTLTVAPRRTRRVTDVLADLFNVSNGAGSLVWSPIRGAVHMQARTLRSGDNPGATVIPLLQRDAGLRLGETRTFAGVEDSATANEGSRGAMRSEIILQEVAGSRARVRLTLWYASARALTATAVSQEIELTPGEARNLGAAGLAILGARREDHGDLHNMQLQVRVVEGEGAVQPLVRVVETSSGDSALRIE